MTNYDNHNPKVTGSSLSGALIVILIVVFGLGLALAGFLAGRATAPSQASQPTVDVATATAKTIDEEEQDISDVPTDSLPTAVISVSESSAESSAIPTPIEIPTTEPPTAEPPTAEPTVEPAPTDEPSPAPSLSDESPISEADLATLYEAWRIIADQYDGEVPSIDKIVDSLIAGSLQSLDDDYTRYIKPDVAERMRQDQQGEIEGIGAFVKENDDGLFEIVRPMPNQPAELAGIKAGDVLIEVDGQSVLDLSFDEVILMVRGQRGSVVDLKFLRDGEPVEFTVVRARFEVPVVEFEILPSEMTGDQVIGYIHLTEFGRTAERSVLDALDQLLAQGATSIVFDLRDNPGGFLDQSVAVADIFLPDGVALYERNIRGLSQVFRTYDGDAAEDIPLVVLVNAASASASEIVAGAIQDRDRAALIGETTFGKGSVQQINTLSDNAELRVTIARWYTPNDNSIDGVGITPDIEIETPETLGGSDDGQLMRAIEYLLTGQ